MLIAAISLSVIGFTLLVVTVVADSHIWTWLLIAVVLAGIVCFGVDEWKRRKR